MINSAIKTLQQKREQFLLNVKRIDRETLFANNRKRLREEDNRTYEVDQVLHLLNGSIVIYNRKDIKTHLKKLGEFNKLSPVQEIKLIKLIDTLLKIKVEEDNSSLHNDCLNILVQLSLLSCTSSELFEMLPVVCKMIDKYNNHINQALSYSIIDKILAFIGNISCNQGFQDYFSVDLITLLVHQIQFGQKRLLFQTLWTLNNILFALHSEQQFLEQILINIASGELPKYLIQYMKKNENKLEKNQLVSIYWLYAELSQFIPYDIAEFQIMDGENEDLMQIILLVYGNLTGQKVLPKYCDFDQVLNLFFKTNNQLIQRQILVIIANLVLLKEVDVQQVKHLIIYSFQQYPIDSMFLLHNCQSQYNLTFDESENKVILKTMNELKSDPIVEQLMQQLKLNN